MRRTRSTFLGVLTGLVCLLATISVLTATPALAQVQTVSDRADKRLQADIRAVAYADREFSAVAAVRLNRVPRVGTAAFTIAPPDSDVAFVARISRDSRGSLKKQLTYETDTSASVQSCAFSADWSFTHRQIKVVVPHDCLRFSHFLSAHWMRAAVNSAGRTDVAASRVVRRGDTPDCVSEDEFRAVRSGQLMNDVHAALDTSGRFAHGGAGGFSRVYKTCRGGTVWIEYSNLNGSSLQVATKGRV